MQYIFEFDMTPSGANSCIENSNCTLETIREQVVKLIHDIKTVVNTLDPAPVAVRVLFILVTPEHSADSHVYPFNYGSSNHNCLYLADVLVHETVLSRFLPASLRTTMFSPRWKHGGRVLPHQTIPAVCVLTFPPFYVVCRCTNAFKDDIRHNVYNSNVSVVLDLQLMSWICTLHAGNLEDW